MAVRHREASIMVHGMGAQARRLGVGAVAVLLCLVGASARADDNRNLDHLTAANGTVWPLLDGVVDPAEWSDASVYTLETNIGAHLTLYLKTVPLHNGPGSACSIFVDATPFAMPCDDYLLIAVSSDDAEAFGYFTVYIDEGDDGAHGSGSGDGVLTVGQEDGKLLRYGMRWTSVCQDYFGLVENCPEPSCVPWDDSRDCWLCGQVDTPAHDANTYCYYGTDPSLTADAQPGYVHDVMDGWAGEALDGVAWQFVAVDTLPPAEGGFFGLVGSDSRGAELAMPFHGVEGEPFDPSDATFAIGDTLNILFNSSAGAYPRITDEYTPTRWIPVRIGGTAEQAEDFVDGSPGCTAESASTMFPHTRSRGVAVFPLLLASALFVGIRGRKRRTAPRSSARR